MSLFFWAILIRALSGLDNAAFYADRKKLALGASALHIVVILAWGFTHATEWVKWASLGIAAAVVVSYWVFATNKSAYMHLSENAITSLFTIVAVMSNGDWIELALAVPIGTLIFNMPINYGDTGLLIEKIDRTDDPTGKTYSIPILGLKVPRIANGYTKAYISLGCLAAYFANTYLWQIGFNLTNFGLWVIKYGLWLVNLNQQ